MVERSFHLSGIGVIDEGMQPYPMELRQRVWQALQEGASSLEAAERFGINDSCVRKWRARVKQTGSLQPATQRRAENVSLTLDTKPLWSKPSGLSPTPSGGNWLRPLASDSGVCSASRSSAEPLSGLGLAGKKTLNASDSNAPTCGAHALVGPRTGNLVSSRGRFSLTKAA